MRADELSRAWRGLVVGAPLTGGHRSRVWEAALGDRRVVVRRSRRPRGSLVWELDLLTALRRTGFGVAEIVPADNGERAVEGYVVQSWVDGREPATASDWEAVAGELDRLHHLLIGVAQRPGCRVVTELGPTSRSVDANLSALPADVRALVLNVFASVRDAPVGVVHGDPSPGNIRMGSGGRVWFLDWDESRVDVTWHDLSNLGVEVLPPATQRRAERLSHAWEVANAWVAEPDYARRRLAALTDS